jgi:copper ion binding protein
MTTNVTEKTYTVSGMSCQHCVMAVSEEVGQVAGVESVDVALETKQVTVRGRDLDDGALRAAIDEAGYEAEG